jgi:hypothetical protein
VDKTIQKPGAELNATSVLLLKLIIRCKSDNKINNEALFKRS